MKSLSELKAAGVFFDSWGALCVSSFNGYIDEEPGWGPFGPTGIARRLTAAEVAIVYEAAGVPRFLKWSETTPAERVVDYEGGGSDYSRIPNHYKEECESGCTLFRFR